MSESWTSLDRFPQYDISSFGRVRNRKTGYQFIIEPSHGGYIRVALTDASGKSAKHLVHRLVAEAFLDHRGREPIDHIDRNKSNNCVDNLRVVTQKQNCQNKRQTNNKSRSIVQMTMGGEVVKIWERIVDAGFPTGNVVSACAGRINSAYGYKWRYADPEVLDETEEWRCICFNNQTLEVSDSGRVKLMSGKIVWGHTMCSGYKQVSVRNVAVMVHRLVCEAFHGKAPSSGSVVDHIDRDRVNNRATNLRWCTLSENGFNQVWDKRRVVKSPVTATLLGGSITFESIAEAARTTGVSQGNICSVCQGNRKSAGGYQWTYAATV